VEVRVVVLVLRDFEVDIQSVRDAIRVDTDREHGVDRASVLPDQPAEVTLPVTGEIHPERPLAEEQFCSAVGVPGSTSGARPGTVVPKRVQCRQPPAASLQLILGDDQLSLGVRGQRNRRRLQRVDQLLNERAKVRSTPGAPVIEDGYAWVVVARGESIINVKPFVPSLSETTEPQLTERVLPDPVVLDRAVGRGADIIQKAHRHTGNGGRAST